MKIRVIDFDDWFDYATEHEIEEITDEAFMEVYDSTGTDWEFDSLDEFAREFNEDGNYAPTPTSHIIRFFPNE